MLRRNVTISDAGPMPAGRGRGKLSQIALMCGSLMQGRISGRYLTGHHSLHKDILTHLQHSPSFAKTNYSPDCVRMGDRAQKQCQVNIHKINDQQPDAGTLLG